MFIEIGGEKHAVKFKHDSIGEKALNSSKKLVTVNRHTECVISKFVQNVEEVVGKGIALCHSSDNFDKEKGRQKALARALENAEYGKDIRSIFWEAYRNWKIKRF